MDAANVAALAALMTFRRPECSLGGEDGQEVIVHPTEEREPLPLIIHHLPIAVTFAFFGSEGSAVIDPTHQEEAVMGGRMTTTLNANGDICAIQKAGGEGVLQSVIMQCLRIASVKAGDVTEKLRKAVDSYNTERALKKIKRHPLSTPMDVDKEATSEVPSYHTKKLKSPSEDGIHSKPENSEGETYSSGQRQTKNEVVKNFIGGPSSWDPYSKGVDPDFLKASLASRGTSTSSKKQEESRNEKMSGVGKLVETPKDVNQGSLPVEAAQAEQQTKGEKTLKDAVKPKNKRKKKPSSSGAS